MPYKICLAGDPAVGKTSLIGRFVHDEFSDKYLSTMGTKVTKMTLEVPGEDAPREVDLLIWDIMGDPGFRQFLKDSYFFGAEGIVLVCDLTRRETVRHLAQWWEVVTEVAGEVPVSVATNKADLVDRIEVQESDVAKVCEPRGWPVTRTSAKTGQGVPEAFRELAARVVRR